MIGGNSKRIGVCCFLLALGLQTIGQSKSYIPNAFHFGLELNSINLQSNLADSASFGTSPILGFRLNQNISNSFDLNFHFLSGKTPQFPIAFDINSTAQFNQFAGELDYKFNNGYLMNLQSKLWPVVFVSYASNRFRKIGDGDDFRVRTNTYGGGGGINYQISDRLRVQYRVAYRNNFASDYTNHWHHQYGIAVRLFSPIKELKKQIVDPIEPPLAGIETLRDKELSYDTLVSLGLVESIEEILANTENKEPEKSGVAWEETKIIAVSGKEKELNERGIRSDLRDQYNGTYFVILGAYKNLKSARSLYKKVGKDVPGTSILETGVQVYRVGVASGRDSTYARRELSFFRLHGFPDAWLLNLEKPIEPILTEKVNSQDVNPPAEIIQSPDEREYDWGTSDSGQQTETTPVVEESSTPTENSTPAVEDNNPYPTYAIDNLESVGNNSNLSLGYYVVVASFLDYTNAESLKSKLSLFGNDLHIIRSQNGYYRVSNYVGNDLLKAERYLAEYKKVYRKDVWLLVVE